MSFSFSVRWLIDTPQVTGKPISLRGADDVERGAAGDLARVIAAAGKLDQADVALEHDGLGGRRDAAKPEPGRDLALVHHAVLARA